MSRRFRKDPVDLAIGDVLTPEDALKTRSLLTGVTASTVRQTWGCGHAIYSVNGDALYSSCPICHVRRLTTEDAPVKAKRVIRGDTTSARRARRFGT